MAFWIKFGSKKRSKLLVTPILKPCYTSKFSKTISERYCQYGVFETCWGSVEHIVTNWSIKKKLLCPKLTGFSWSFDFNCPKTWFWSLLENFPDAQIAFPGKLRVFCWAYTFPGNGWCTCYGALLSSLKCYAWSANLRI